MNNMKSKKLSKKAQLAVDMLVLLEEEYPEAECALFHKNVYELLVKVTLSAQTTDVSVNKISNKLFSLYPNPEAMAVASIEKLEDILKTIGMYKTKAARIKEQARILVNNFGGEVPEDDQLLQTLPGVGRKTANVVMSVGFGHQRIAVDTHVFRVSNRMGIVKEKDVLKTELALMNVLPKNLWSKAHHSLIFHGRACCIARKPRCNQCPIEGLCKKVGIDCK